MTAALAPFPSHPPLPFDPTLPAAERCAKLVHAFPPALQSVFEAGRLDRRPRFSDDRFDGLTERWSPPPTVTAQEAAMARRALNELRATILAPAPPDRLLARLLALLSHYPAKAMPPEVEQMIALDWASDLGDYPAWVVDAAARVWRRTRKWRPSIVEMRTICDEIGAPEFALAKRLRAVIDAGDARHGASAHDMRVREMAARSIRRIG